MSILWIFLSLALNPVHAKSAPPIDNETCFSPDEPCDEKLVSFIESAKHSLDIAIFEMTDKKVAHAIADAANRIPVRMIVNPKLAKEMKPAFQIVYNSKAKIRKGKQKGIMHNKFTIVDDSRIETGSFNYTDRASAKNQENQIYLSTPKVVERYKEHFEVMWKKSKELK